MRTMLMGPLSGAADASLFRIVPGNRAVQRESDDDRGAPPDTIADHERPAERLRALAHADETEPTACSDTAHRRSHSMAVVLDHQPQESVTSTEGDRARRGAAVLRDVAERLLHDAVHTQFDLRSQPRVHRLGKLRADARASGEVPQIRRQGCKESEVVQDGGMEELRHVADAPECRLADLP